MSSFGQSDFLIPLTVSGALSTGIKGVPLPVPVNAEVVGVHANVGTAPTGADIHIDIAVNGTDSLANQVVIAATKTSGQQVVTNTPAGSGLDNQPNLLSGNNWILAEYPAPVVPLTINAGQTVQVDIKQIGSTIAGSDLGLVLHCVKK